MMTKTKVEASAATEDDEELFDTLIAISVVAKRLAKNLRQTTESEETTNE